VAYCGSPGTYSVKVSGTRGHCLPASDEEDPAHEDASTVSALGRMNSGGGDMLDKAWLLDWVVVEIIYHRTNTSCCLLLCDRNKHERDREGQIILGNRPAKYWEGGPALWSFSKYLNILRRERFEFQGNVKSLIAGLRSDVISS